MKPQEFQFRLMQAMQAGNWRRRPARAPITRILVVEDNEDDAVLIGETLAGRNDFVVLAAVGDGGEALAFLRREGKYEAAERPDLVLLDIQMPGKDGLEVLREIRREADLTQVPVILLTGLGGRPGLAGRDRIEEGLSLGASGYLAKPVAQAPLVETIRTIRRTRAAGGPGPQGIGMPERPLVLLVAEDDPNDLAFLQEVLASLPIPCVVHDVPDGESALSFLRRRGPYQAAPRPDIVLLDVRMPGRDGFEVLREIRCDPSLAGIRTVILTGFAPKGWIEEDWADRADAYLHKPVETAPLLETIRLLLEGAVS